MTSTCADTEYINESGYQNSYIDDSRYQDSFHFDDIVQACFEEMAREKDLARLDTKDFRSNSVPQKRRRKEKKKYNNFRGVDEGMLSGKQRYMQAFCHRHNTWDDNCRDTYWVSHPIDHYNGPSKVMTKRDVYFAAKAENTNYSCRCCCCSYPYTKGKRDRMKGAGIGEELWDEQDYKADYWYHWSDMDTVFWDFEDDYQSVLFNGYEDGPIWTEDGWPIRPEEEEEVEVCGSECDVVSEVESDSDSGEWDFIWNQDVSSSDDEWSVI